jgi:FKBP-type peptidyl-prolyl cis-trans isomerase
LPVPILIEAAHILKPGGRVRLEATAKFAFGDRLQPGIAPDAPTVWEVELLEIKKPMPVPPFEMPAADKLKRTASGLAYEVIREGAGKTPKLGKEITVHYAGWTADGMLFDSTYQRATPMVRPFGNVIQGWVEGLQLMKEGAIYKFVIPSNLGYGKPGNPDAKIPPDTTLVFWLELVSCAE